ncbi:sensor histidine kinase [Nocardioides abyssi]|uniref:histidine kinase n=1 Tax=Nocardioides abyssi TaxID=3058370 RepID=A0ABT8EXI9_9ACTN|nr:PAS domain-containing sensor histidine kinase [Nocardioides abyssi]MDN4162900.1 ATP-binding protein [Nocardioides abyssi]
MRDLVQLRPMDAVRALVATGRPDPRVLQAVFAFFVSVDFAIRGLAGGGVGLVGWPGAGLALTLVTTVLAFTVPWHRFREDLVTVIPVLDVAALGAVRLSPDGSAAGILVVVPALWLGRQLGRRGAGVVALAVALLTAVPGLLVLGADSIAVSRAVMIVVVAAWSALAIAFGLERIRYERDEAERRGEELAEALRRIEEQQRTTQAIFDAVDVGLVLLDHEGRYRDHNRRQAELLALAHPDGHAGRAGQAGLVFADDGVTVLEPDQEPAARAARGEEFEDCRTWFGEDPAERRALAVSARALRTADGAFAGAALAYKDVTDLVEALAVKDDFVALVSHELRTPLTSITGYVEMLQDRTDLPDVVVGQLEVVDRNARRLLHLVGGLLDSALHASGPMPLDRSRRDLVAVVRDAVEAAGPAARVASLQLEVELPDELWLDLDALRIGQVVDNLLSNAVKYTRPGGTVTVCLTADPTQAHLAVSDTGIGISPADRERLFTRFFRSRQAEELCIQGLGLGLPITRTIVEAHGGSIDVDSRHGHGSTFTVHLPLS